MTNSILLLGAALALTITAAPAAEDAISANFIMQGCRDFLDPKSKADALQGMCAGTVSAIAVMGRLMNFSLKRSPLPTNDFRRLTLCIDEPDTPLGQQVRVVVAYIDARPHEAQGLRRRALQA